MPFGLLKSITYNKIIKPPSRSNPVIAYIINTIAGNGIGGYGGDGGQPTNASLNYPSNVYLDLSGNIFIADSNNNRIRFISKNGGTYYGVSTTTGNIYTIAGNGTQGYSGDGGAPTNAKLSIPTDVYVDSSGNVFIADDGNYRIRFISKSGGTYYGIPTTAGNIYTIAGNNNNVYNGDNIAPTNASLNMNSVYVDSTGNIFIADYNNNNIRFISKSGGTYYGVPTTAGRIYTIAGNGNVAGGYSGDGGLPTNAILNYPSGVYVDSTGNVFIVDQNNNRIRFISKSGGIYYGIPTTAGNIYTIAGNGTGGYSGDGGAPTNASLNYPQHVYVDSTGNVFIADNTNNCIRFISKNGGTYYGILTNAGSIYTIAGNGNLAGGYSGDGGPPTNAKLRNPYGVYVDSTGIVYISDFTNSRIRKIQLK